MKLTIPRTSHELLEGARATLERLTGELNQATKRVTEMEGAARAATDKLRTAQVQVAKAGAGKEPSSAPVAKAEADLEQARARVEVLRSAITSVEHDVEALIRDHPELLDANADLVSKDKAHLRAAIDTVEQAFSRFFFDVAVGRWLRDPFGAKSFRPIPMGPVLRTRGGDTVGLDEAIAALRTTVDPTPAKRPQPTPSLAAASPASIEAAFENEPDLGVAAAITKDNDMREALAAHSRRGT